MTVIFQPCQSWLRFISHFHLDWIWTSAEIGCITWGPWLDMCSCARKGGVQGGWKAVLLCVWKHGQLPQATPVYVRRWDRLNIVFSVVCQCCCLLPPVCCQDALSPRLKHPFIIREKAETHGSKSLFVHLGSHKTEASYDWHSRCSGEEDGCWTMPWILLEKSNVVFIDL